MLQQMPRMIQLSIGLERKTSTKVVWKACHPFHAGTARRGAAAMEAGAAACHPSLRRQGGAGGELFVAEGGGGLRLWGGM